MYRLRLLVPFLLILGLSACATSVWDSDEMVAKSHYVHKGPPSITLVTVIQSKTGGGGHSGLMINAHERVIYDPAGNFNNGANRGIVAERNDLLFGITPPILDAYYDFHSREEWYVVTQEIEVTPEIAALIYQRTVANGSGAAAFCANNISAILHNIPGFESIRVSLSPLRIMEDFAKLPGVKTNKIYQVD